MATVKVILKIEKIKKNNEAPLYLRVIKDRKTSYISLGINIEPDCWDPDKETVKKKHPNLVRYNHYISKKKSEAQGNIVESLAESEYVTVKKLKQVVKGLAAMPFFPFAYNYIKTYMTNGQLKTYMKYKTAVDKVKGFVEKDTLTFEELTVTFLRKLEEHLRTKHENCTNTVTKDLKCLKRIIGEAIQQGVMKMDKNPFLNYKLHSEDGERIFLTEEELAAFEALKIEPDSKLYHAWNMYIFACNTGGIRFSDLLHLKWENFNGQHILLKTSKTGTVISVKVPTKGIDILEKYRKEDSQPTDHIFPVIDMEREFSDGFKKLHYMTTLNSKMNAYLNKLAKMAGINKYLHFHTSRHTWATRALRNGMRIEYVSKLMGHSNIKITQVYAKIVNADLDKAMDDFEKACLTVEKTIKEKKDKEEKKSKPIKPGLDAAKKATKKPDAKSPKK